MPELPDVAVFKQYLDATSLHQCIGQTRVFDDAVIERVTAATLQRRLSGRAFEETRRRGKHLFARLTDGDAWLGLHFGMSGYLRYRADKGDLPPYTRIRFDFENGAHLAYVCPRKLGRLRIVDDLDAFIEDHQLGPDALDGVDLDTFRERVGDRRGGIKSALMNQQVLAGLGNVYTDEILFHARIHPQSKIDALSTGDLRTLFHKMKDVLQTAIHARARPADMPSSYLLPHRSKGEPCPRCDGEVEKITVNGRSTYVCTKCQERKG